MPRARRRRKPEHPVVNLVVKFHEVELPTEHRRRKPEHLVVKFQEQTFSLLKLQKRWGKRHKASTTPISLRMCGEFIFPPPPIPPPLPFLIAILREMGSV